MTHTPPIPAANQSPYPLQQAPQTPAPPAPPPGEPRVAHAPGPVSIPVPAVIALAAGIGIAAIAGGLFYAFSGAKARGKPGKAKKRRAAKSAQA